MTKTDLLTRRSFVKKSLQFAAVLGLTGPLESIAGVTAQPMDFYHTHTGERLKINYSCGDCLPSTLNKVNNFLRDFRTGDVYPIDPKLLDILYGIKLKSGSNGVIEVISGFRSPKTNDILRSKSNNVAKKSLHMKGQALDFRLTDLKTTDLRDVAVSLRRGGVGFYGKSDFVHLDTGHFRTW